MSSTLKVYDYTRKGGNRMNEDRQKRLEDLRSRRDELNPDERAELERMEQDEQSQDSESMNDEPIK